MFGRYRRPIGPLASMALALLVAAIWCEVWDAEIGTVYHKTEEGRAAPLRRVYIDEPRPAGLEALQGVVYTPTFVLLDAGREVGRILGYPG